MEDLLLRLNASGAARSLSADVIECYFTRLRTDPDSYMLVYILFSIRITFSAELFLLKIIYYPILIY